MKNLDALRRAEVEFEIIPGVTAASAAAASAKITLTDRRAASSLVVVTAHNCRNASLSETVEPARSIYALVHAWADYSKTVQGLLESGHEPKTPCAVVSNAGRANEEVRYLTLHELHRPEELSAPAVLIVGEVAAEHLHRRMEICFPESRAKREIPTSTTDSRFTQLSVNPVRHLTERGSDRVPSLCPG